MLVRRTFLALLLVAVAFVRADEPKSPAKAELTTLKGEVIEGELVSVAKDKIVFAKGDEKLEFNPEQVLQINYRPENRPKGNEKWSDVEMSDGTLLHCDQFLIKGKEVELTLLSGQKVKMPLTAVANILLAGEDEKQRKDWTARLAKKKPTDVLVAKNPVGGISALDVTFEEGSEDGKAISLTRQGDSEAKQVALTREKVIGLIFVRELDPKAKAVLFKLMDTERNLVMVSETELTAEGLTVTTPSGAKIAYPTALVARLDFNRGQLTFLSGLKPDKELNPSDGEGLFRYRRNVNLDGKPLNVGGTVYTNGLALHAHTELEYNLKGEFRQFNAVVGIDPGVKGLPGPTVLKIEGDGKELLSLTMKRDDKVKAHPVALNIKDVQTLKIVVTSGDWLDLGKHLNLADAKVSK
jgi:hypothetical protein